MANTFLNTARTVTATSNPITNVQQVANNNLQQQPITSNVNGTSGVQSTQTQQQNSNNINPITIPIQIQPQIAQTGQQLTNSNIQTISNQQQINAQQNPAPTPQQYQGNTQNSNIVDFDQIYKSYQSQYGNNQTNNNIGVSGVKKTTMGSTIVTPTTTNLNSVEGQYQSAYSDTINGVISEMFSQLESLRSGNFGYDPSQDMALRMASEYAANSTLQHLAGSGVLNSSATAERVARIVSELIPQYEQKAYDRQMQYLSQLADTAQIVMQFDSQQFSYWKDAKDREFQNKQYEYQKQQDELENAWKRVDELGYVDNYASTVLGVKVGTLSGKAREAKEEREFELQKMREQLEIERANEEALYRIKSELDLERNRQLASYESELRKNEAEYDYKLAQQYSNSSNYSDYDEIIKNRYAEYNDITKQYVVPNEETYNELYNYLGSLRDNNLINDEELSRLAAKYSKYSNQSSVTSTISNNAGLNSSNLETWIKALDGNNNALDSLGVTIFGQKKSNVNNNDARKAVQEALRQIESGEYTFTSNQQLMDDLKNHKFGHLGWGF